MSIKIDDNETNRGTAPYPIRCAKCHMDLRATGWRSGPVEHCTGGVSVFGCWNHAVHHGHRYQFCKGCKVILGCDYCLKDDPISYICTECDLFGDGTPVRSDEKRAKVSDLLKALFIKLDHMHGTNTEKPNGKHETQ